MNRVALANLIWLATVCGLSTVATGAINPVLNYQGVLTDSAGLAYPDGTYLLTFSIYDDSIGGAQLWAETQEVETKGGFVHAYLGSQLPFDPSIWTVAPLWLGIQLEGEPEFRPRHLIAASVYAFEALNAQQLEGLPPAHFASVQSLTDAIAQHQTDSAAHRPLNLDASEIVSGVLDSERLPEITVDSDNVVDGSLQGVDLADSTITGDKISAGAIGSSHLAEILLTGEQIADGTLTGVDLADSTIDGSKLAAGSVSDVHLSISAISGDNIVDGSITTADLADSLVTGSKIAAGSIESAHLSNIAITGDQIADETITGEHILDGSIGFWDIGAQVIQSHHIANASILGFKIAPSTLTGSHIQDETLTAADIASNSIENRHLVNNSVTAEKTLDEPGVGSTTGGVLPSVGTTITNWMSLTINAPAAGYLLVFFNGIASLNANDVAQASISTSPTSFGSHYGEAKLASGSSSVGANMTISISQIIPVASAGPVTVYGNVKASPLSATVVDFYNGAMQAIFITTAY